LRVGKTPACRAAQRGRASESEASGPPYARWLLIAVGVVVLLAALRLGGVVVLRAALPPLLLAAVVVAVLYVGRRNGRW
jgi:hypothetical protein